MNMPADFAGVRNLLLIAFQRNQQKDVDTWLQAMPAMTREHPSLRYYELPTISKLNPVARYFIDNGMRGGIPDRQQRARAITLYIDKTPFKQALALPSEDRIYALLIDPSGRILWRSEGLFTAAKGQSLQTALLSAGPATPAPSTADTHSKPDSVRQPRPEGRGSAQGPDRAHR